MVIQAGMGENEEPVSKTAKGKGAGDVDQAVEHLPSRHKTLSSNHSITKKNWKSIHVMLLIF
jgi:hypothetical protein